MGIGGGGGEMTTAWYRYVRHEDIAAFEAVGWRRVDGLTPCLHDFWSTILEWAGEGEPINPDLGCLFRWVPLNSSDDDSPPQP